MLGGRDRELGRREAPRASAVASSGRSSTSRTIRPGVVGALASLPRGRAAVCVRPERGAARTSTRWPSASGTSRSTARVSRSARVGVERDAPLRRDRGEVFELGRSSLLVRRLLAVDQVDVDERAVALAAPRFARRPGDLVDRAVARSDGSGRRRCRRRPRQARDRAGAGTRNRWWVRSRTPLDLLGLGLARARASSGSAGADSTAVAVGLGLRVPSTSATRPSTSAVSRLDQRLAAAASRYPGTPSRAASAWSSARCWSVDSASAIGGAQDIALTPRPARLSRRPTSGRLQAPLGQLAQPLRELRPRLPVLAESLRPSVGQRVVRAAPSPAPATRMRARRSRRARDDVIEVARSRGDGDRRRARDAATISRTTAVSTEMSRSPPITTRRWRRRWPRAAPGWPRRRASC